MRLFEIFWLPLERHATIIRYREFRIFLKISRSCLLLPLTCDLISKVMSGETYVPYRFNAWNLRTLVFFWWYGHGVASRVVLDWWVVSQIWLDSDSNESSQSWFERENQEYESSQSRLRWTSFDQSWVNWILLGAKLSHWFSEEKIAALDLIPPVNNFWPN